MSSRFLDQSFLGLATVEERQALALTAQYLRRTGTTIASHLIRREQWSVQPILFEALRDNLLAGAELCDGLSGLDDSEPKWSSISAW